MQNTYCSLLAMSVYVKLLRAALKTAYSMSTTYSRQQDVQSGMNGSESRVPP